MFGKKNAKASKASKQNSKMNVEAGQEASNCGTRGCSSQRSPKSSK